MRFQKLGYFSAVFVLILTHYPDPVQAGDKLLVTQGREFHTQNQRDRHQVNHRNRASTNFHGLVTSFSHSYGPVTSWGNARFSNGYNSFPRLYRSPGTNYFGSPNYRFKQHNDYSRGYRQGYRDAYRDSRK